MTERPYKIKHRPNVYLIAYTHLYKPGLKMFLKDTGRRWPTAHTEERSWSPVGDDPFPGWLDVYPGDALPEFAGRHCYDSFEGGQGAGRKTNEGYMKNIVSSGHGSVLEHWSASFLVMGASRGFTHEIVRHRVGTAFSQSSTRYCDGDQLNVVMPQILRALQANVDPSDRETIDDLYKLFEDAYCDIKKNYTEALEALVEGSDEYLDLRIEAPGKKTKIRKILRSAARYLLPIGTEAPILVSSNLRTLRHLFLMRGSVHAELEIRDVVVQMFEIVRGLAPNALFDVEPVSFPDGTTGLKVEHEKV